MVSLPHGDSFVQGICACDKVPSFYKLWAVFNSKQDYCKRTSGRNFMMRKSYCSSCNKGQGKMNLKKNNAGRIPDHKNDLSKIKCFNHSLDTLLTSLSRESK